jgi:hypothetical protein
MALLRQIGRGIRATDRAQIAMTGPLRASVAITVVVACMLLVDEPIAAIPLAIGMLFSAVADPEGAYAGRARVMVWATAWMTLTTLLGGLVSDVLVLHLAAAAVVAAVCGFVGAAGPRAAMVGVLALVCFTIFSGSPVVLYDSVTSAALVAIGGLIQTALTIAPWPWGRANGLRSEFATFYRGLAHAARAPARGGDLVSPAHAARLRRVEEEFANNELTGESSRWFDQLLVDGRAMRFGLVGVTAARADLAGEPAGAALDAFVAAVGATSSGTANTLVWHGRRGTLVSAMQKLDDAADRCHDFPAEISRALVETVHVALMRTAAADDPLEQSIIPRATATVIAGALVLAATATLWPSRCGVAVCAALADTIGALDAYIVRVLRGDAAEPADMDETRASLLLRRSDSATVVATAAYEVGRQPLPPDHAQAIAHDLNAATAWCMEADVARGVEADPTYRDSIRGELADLRQRLTRLQADGTCPPRRHPPAVDHPLHRYIRLAHTVVDG